MCNHHRSGREEGAQLHSEQLAAVDLLVLVRIMCVPLLLLRHRTSTHKAQARSLVGFGDSSFTWFAAELRAFHDHDRNSTVAIMSEMPVVNFRRTGVTFDI